ncbi:MAG: conjugal transfer protein TraW [Burkholderiales bacterium]|nr:conjugal transfer protein TraW [Burkholderiales bacterium]
MKKLSLSILTAALMATAAPARAGCCAQPDVVAAVWGAAQWTATQINLYISKLAGVVEGSAKMIIQNQAESTKAINQQAAEREKNMELYRLGQQYQLPPDPCTLGAIATHAEAMHRAQGAISSSFQPGGSRSRLQNLKAADSYVNAPADVGPEARAAALVGAHAKHFCDVEEAKKYGGTRVCQTTGELPGADAKAETLLSGAKARPGDPDSYTFTQKQIEAAQTLISNASDPLPVRGLNKAEANTRAGVEYYALALSGQAKMSFSQQSMRDALARRVPVPEGKALVAAITKGNPSAAAYYARLPHLKTEGISALDLQDAEVARRYRNPQWMVDMSAASPAAVAREQAFMTALLLDFQMRQQLSNERQEIMLGQIAAALTRADMTPKLEAAYRAVRAQQ